MQNFRVFKGHRRHIGRGDHRLDHLDCTWNAHDVALFPFALAPKPGLYLMGRAQRHSIKPGSQQVGVSDRASLAGQDEEDGLKGILGMVPVAQDLAADAQNHWPVPRYQSGEGHFRAGIAPGGEPLDELAVSQSGNKAAVEEGLNLPAIQTCYQMCHVRGLTKKLWFTLIPSLNSTQAPSILSQVAAENSSELAQEVMKTPDGTLDRKEIEKIIGLG